MKALRYCTACILAGLLFGTLLASASAQELARIDGTVITEKDFLSRVMLLAERSRKALDKEKFMNKLLDEELLIREAQRMNLHENEDYRIRVETYKKELLVNLYLQQYLKEKNTEESQKKYYEDNRDKFMSPEMVRISIILSKTENEAKEILKKAKDGGDFQELAKKYSKDPSSLKGGDFGFRAKKGLRKDFADVAFSMKKGDISAPIKLDEGYYIIKLTDYQPERIATFEEVKARISGDYSNKLMKEKIAELRKAVNIQIKTAELKNLKID